MKAEFTHEFIRIYKKRYSRKANIQKRFEERLRKFVQDPADSQLRDHKLTKKLEGKRAFL